MFYQVLKRHFSKRFYLAESDAEIVSFLVQVYEIYQQIKRKNTTDPIFVVVKNVQNVQLVKKMFERDRILMNDYLDEEMPAEAETEVSEPIPSAEALKEEADQFAAVDLSFLLKKTTANLPEPESKNPFATLRWDSTPGGTAQRGNDAKRLLLIRNVRSKAIERNEWFSLESI